jgi:hypothetical protein
MGAGAMRLTRRRRISILSLACAEWAGDQENDPQ